MVNLLKSTELSKQETPMSKSSHPLENMKYLFLRSLSPGKNDLFSISYYIYQQNLVVNMNRKAKKSLFNNNCPKTNAFGTSVNLCFLKKATLLIREFN